METKKEEKENKVNNFFKKSWGNLKNTKKNFNTVRNNPYAFHKFQYYIFRGIIIFVGIVIIIQLILMFKSFSSAGSNKLMSNLTRAFLVLVGGMIIMKLYGFVDNMKKMLLHYETNPVTIDNYANEKKIDLNSEIDSILNKYSDNGKLKEAGKK